MKRIISFFLVGIMVLSLFSACNTNGDDKNPDTDSSESSEGDPITDIPQRDTVSIDNVKRYNLTNTQKIFYSGYQNAPQYRIPALVVTNSGVRITAIDKGHASDRGDISLMVRRSLDGKKWEEGVVLLDPPYGVLSSSHYHALTIDVSLVYDKEIDRTFLFTSLYPESQANMNHDVLTDEIGYKTVNGESRLILRDYEPERGLLLTSKTYENEYTVGADGTVYDKDNKKTEYTLPSFADGTLYKNGKEAGNIFLYTGNEQGELTVVPTSYLICTYSDDDGVTWSEPYCINDQVRPEGKIYFGVGPGAGIQLESGRLVFSTWSCAVKEKNESVETYAVYSDDHGKSWHSGDAVRIFDNNEAQLVELTDKNGNKILKMFGRHSKNPYIATSFDGGESWDRLYIETALPCPSCQVTVTALPFDVEGYEGKQLVVYAGAGSSSSRVDGKAWLGVYDEQTDRFEWIASRQINSGQYMYSCLAVTNDNNIALLYEGPGCDIIYTEFHIGFLLGKK